MGRGYGKFVLPALALLAASLLSTATILAKAPGNQGGTIGVEVAVASHLRDGDEYSLSVRQLIAYGEELFRANWTVQEGAGRPLTKGTGTPLADPDQPLVFPRNVNRISGPDANSCAGCHNSPYGIAGGGGDFVTNVFVLGQRFDFVTFDHDDTIPTKGAVDEAGEHVLQETVANSRATLGMFGSGYIEMLARQMTADLQAIRDTIEPGDSAVLETKGVHFGVLARDAEGNWDVSAVEGLPVLCLKTDGPDDPPSLIVHPFHQAGAVVSLRQFTNSAYNHHHGMQASERFGDGADPDGDGITDELTRADITAVTLYQAGLAPPGRVIPNDPDVEQAVLLGQTLFQAIGCAECHIPSLPLDEEGWIFSEPNPYNPDGNWQVGDGPALNVDLSDWRQLPSPRLVPDRSGVVHVPAFTDLKLHNITQGADDPNAEPLDMTHPAGSEEFFEHNQQFLTRKLWGVANEPPYFHHGRFTTMRQAVENHFGEADRSRQMFMGELKVNGEFLTDYERASIIEFLKTLQVLPPGTHALVVDEHGRPKRWPSFD